MLNAEPTSSSILGLECKIDQDCLQVCRGPNKECPSELTQRVVLSFVSSVFDSMGFFCTIYDEDENAIEEYLDSSWTIMG